MKKDIWLSRIKRLKLQSEVHILLLHSNVKEWIMRTIEQRYFYSMQFYVAESDEWVIPGRKMLSARSEDPCSREQDWGLECIQARVRFWKGEIMMGWWASSCSEACWRDPKGRISHPTSGLRRAASETSCGDGLTLGREVQKSPLSMLS